MRNKFSLLWKKGDKIGLRLPMPTRLVHAHEKVKANKGRAAITRRPLVYYTEGLGNAGDTQVFSWINQPLKKQNRLNPRTKS